MLYNRAYKLICNDLATLRTSGRPEEMRDPDTPSQLTIEDVAQLAGVSVSSARNYFSRPQLLSTPTHARLKAAVAQTGTTPAAASAAWAAANAAGSALRSHAARTPPPTPSSTSCC
jgi:hypothetical protein